ncbi:MAG: site-specific integrase [Lentisphaeraceae bacterium]|nr:site-specific integrase [Lentisphaeraceae bacterium]
MKGSLYQRDKFWYYEYQPPTGKRIRRSMKTADYQEAEQKAFDLYGHLWQKDVSQAIAQGLEKLEKSQEEELKLSTTLSGHYSIPLTQIFEEYERVLKITSKGTRRHKNASVALSPRSIRDARRRLDRFLAFLKEKHPNLTKMNQVSAYVVRDYFKGFEGALSTYNRHLSDLTTIFNRLKIEGGLKTNPFKSVQLFSKSEILDETVHKQPFTPDELLLIQEKATGWMNIAFLLGFYTSLRLSDVLTLKWSLIDFEGCFIDMRGKTNRTRKNSKDALFYVPELISPLKDWKQESIKADKFDSIYVFDFAPKLVKRDNSAYWSSSITKFLKSIGIQIANEEGKTVKSFHSLRKSYATQMSSLGMGIDKIARHLTDSEQVTENYYVMLNDDQEKSELVRSYLPLNIESIDSEHDDKIIFQMMRLTKMIKSKNKLTSFLNWASTQD